MASANNPRSGVFSGTSTPWIMGLASTQVRLEGKSLDMWRLRAEPTVCSSSTIFSILTEKTKEAIKRKQKRAYCRRCRATRALVERRWKREDRSWRGRSEAGLQTGVPWDCWMLKGYLILVSAKPHNVELEIEKKKEEGNRTWAHTAPERGGVVFGQVHNSLWIAVPHIASLHSPLALFSGLLAIKLPLWSGSSSSRAQCPCPKYPEYALLDSSSYAISASMAQTQGTPRHPWMGHALSTSRTTDQLASSYWFS